MIKLAGFFISIFLIAIIFLQIPKDAVGLSNFAAKTDLLGSPGSAQRLLKILTVFCILIYLGIAFQLNLING